MRRLTSEKPEINRVRLLLLQDARYQLQAHLNHYPEHPAPLCNILVRAVGRVHDVTGIQIGYNTLNLESFNLRAYLAQELADGHSGEKQRNMNSYLWHAGLLDTMQGHNERILTANLAREAWLDRMIETLTATLKEKT